MDEELNNNIKNNDNTALPAAFSGSKTNIDLSVLDNLSEQERELALKILNEYATQGSSETWTDLLTEDYEEIPVDIDTFLHDATYLGNGLVNDEGKFTVFPYWVNILREVFPNSLETNYNTLILSGAIGLGKSFIAVICMLYLLYRMLCLKDPYKHYGLQPIDHITFSVMNITLDAAKGVAWAKLQELVQLSPWFLAHGTMSRSAVNPEWQPNKNIELIFGSQPRHVIGRAVFCLDGETEIFTDKGIVKLKDSVDKDIYVYSYNDKGELTLSNSCTVRPTIQSNIEYEIGLEDGSIIKCTPNHKLLLKNGKYKEAQDLTEEDELADIKPFGYIYMLTNKINGKIYIGKREKPSLDEGYWGSGTWLKSALKKYGIENFDRKILTYAFDRESLCALEQEYTDFYGLPNPEIGYNLKRGGMKGSSGSKHTEHWREQHSGSGNGRYGKPVSIETREKISRANKGRGKGIKNPKKGRPGQKKPEGFGEKISKANKGKIVTLETRKNISRSQKGKMIYTDGINEKVILPGQQIPKNYYRGRKKAFIEYQKNLPHNGLKGEKNPMYGKTHTAEVKKKISDKAKARLAEYNPCSKKVICIETGVIYKSIKEANEKNNLKSVGACVMGRTRTAGKLHWRFYNEN